MKTLINARARAQSVGKSLIRNHEANVRPCEQSLAAEIVRRYIGEAVAEKKELERERCKWGVYTCFERRRGFSRGAFNLREGGGDWGRRAPSEFSDKLYELSEF